MSDSDNGDPAQARPPDPPPESLERVALARRLSEDELRLARDEALLASDEARLAQDEQRLAAEEEAARLARGLSVMSFALAVVLAVAMTGVVIGVIALREHVDAISTAVPNDSVATGAIQDGAVTGAKLADRSVSARTVRRDSLTGAHVREDTLDMVPAARFARTARNASNASELGGLSHWAYVSGVETAVASSATDTAATKGPIVARCPFATHVISGGAGVEGPVRGVALVRSEPNGTEAWLAAAAGNHAPSAPWRLVVRAICATGGR